MIANPVKLIDAAETILSRISDGSFVVAPDVHQAALRPLQDQIKALDKSLRKWHDDVTGNGVPKLFARWMALFIHSLLTDTAMLEHILKSILGNSVPESLSEFQDPDFSVDSARELVKTISQRLVWQSEFEDHIKQQRYAPEPDEVDIPTFIQELLTTTWPQLEVRHSNLVGRSARIPVGPMTESILSLSHYANSLMNGTPPISVAANLTTSHSEMIALEITIGLAAGQQVNLPDHRMTTVPELTRPLFYLYYYAGDMMPPIRESDSIVFYCLLPLRPNQLNPH